MRPPPWKVGELARYTGLSVRTLHWYDEIGLLVPSCHSEAGHRLYAAEDVARLQQIKSLRQLGLSLEEVRDCLDRPDFSPLALVRTHLVRLREQIEVQRRLCGRLEAIASRFEAAETVSVEDLVQTIEDMSMLENYYTPEQLEQLKERKAQVGEERIHQVQEEWPKLIAEVKAEMERGTDPTAASAQALAKRWMALVNEFTGGDAGIAQSLKRLWEERADDLIAQHGPQYDSRPVWDYIGQAMAAAKKAE